MSEPRVVIDADVLGRQRTGDESYVSALLSALSALDHGLSLAAVTRRPDLVPDAIEPIRLDARSQILRMSVGLPTLLRRLRPRLAHFQHVVPPWCPCPAVVTIHDLSFERHPQLMGWRDRLVFRTMVPRSVRSAARVVTVSEWTKRDLIEHYGVLADKIVVTPNGVDPLFRPGPSDDRAPYALFVGTLQQRKDPIAALEAVAMTNADLRLVLVGPDKGLGEEARRAAGRLGLNGRVEFAGHVEKQELAKLYRGAVCLVFPSLYEGFGLPVVEAMASGTPVVAAASGSIPEVAGDAAVLVEPGDPVALAGGIERAIADRERLVRAGLERDARRLPRARVSVAGIVVTHGDHPDLGRCLASFGPQVDELVVVANLPLSTELPRSALLLENERPTGFAANVNRGVAKTQSEFVVIANPDTEPAPDAVAILVEFAAGGERRGVVGPQLRYPDGRWQPSRRRFPTVTGTVVRRTPLRNVFNPFKRQRTHYQLDERPREPVQSDWMLAAFLLLRSEMLEELGGFDEGFRLYGEDIELCYRAAKAGWERWYVPAAVVTHRYAAEIDRRFLTRRTLWHWRGIARFVRKHPERLRAL